MKKQKKSKNLGKAALGVLAATILIFTGINILQVENQPTEIVLDDGTKLLVISAKEMNISVFNIKSTADIQQVGDIKKSKEWAYMVDNIEIINSKNKLWQYDEFICTEAYEIVPARVTAEGLWLPEMRNYTECIRHPRFKINESTGDIINFNRSIKKIDDYSYQINSYGFYDPDVKELQTIEGVDCLNEISSTYACANAIDGLWSQDADESWIANTEASWIIANMSDNITIWNMTYYKGSGSGGDRSLYSYVISVYNHSGWFECHDISAFEHILCGEGWYEITSNYSNTCATYEEIRGCENYTGYRFKINITNCETGSNGCRIREWRIYGENVSGNGSGGGGGSPDLNWTIWNTTDYQDSNSYLQSYVITFEGFPNQTSINATDQNDSTCLFRVHNNGTAAGDVKLHLNETPDNVTTKADDDLTYADAVTITTTAATVKASLAAGSAVDICIWQDFGDSPENLQYSWNVTIE